MPRHKKPLYVHPSRRGSDWDPTYANMDPDLGRRVDPFDDLPDDGCPFTEICEPAIYEGKQVLFPLGKNKMYPEYVSRRLSKIFETKFLPPSEGGDKWTHLPDWIKGFYFDELRKEFFMPNKLQRETWKVFEFFACKLYAGKINETKAQGRRPDWIDPEAWEQWNVYWRRADVEDVAVKNKANRLKPRGDQDGSSRHFMGSQSTAIAAIKAELKNDPKCLWDIFQMEKFKNGSYIDGRAQTIALEYLSGLDALGENPTAEQKYELFLHVNPPDEHGVVYGVGSHGTRLTYSQTSSSSASKQSRSSQSASSSRMSDDYMRQSMEREEAYLRRQMELEAEVAAARARERSLYEYLCMVADKSGLPPPPPPEC